MSEARSIEEYVYGPDGDRADALYGAVEDAIAKAAAGQVERVKVEVRLQDEGDTRTRGVWDSSFATDDPAPAVCQALMQRLQQDPSESYHGAIRLIFRSYDGDRTYLGSFRRKLRPGPMTAVVEASAPGALPADLAAIQATIAATVKPLVDLHLRTLGDASNVIHQAGVMMGHAAQMLGANKPASAADQITGQGMIPDLLRGVIKVAEHADGGTPAANGQAGGGQAGGGQAGGPQPTVSRPPLPPGMTLPPRRPPPPGSYDQGGGGGVLPPGPPAARAPAPAPAALPAPAKSADQMFGELQEWLRASPENRAAARGRMFDLAGELND